MLKLRLPYLAPAVRLEIREGSTAHVSYGLCTPVCKTCPLRRNRSCAKLCHSAGGELAQIQFLRGHYPRRQLNVISAVSSGFWSRGRSYRYRIIVSFLTGAGRRQTVKVPPISGNAVLRTAVNTSRQAAIYFAAADARWRDLSLLLRRFLSVHIHLAIYIIILYSCIGYTRWSNTHRILSRCSRCR